MRALLIGESWGVNEAQYKHPFVGRSGQELCRMASEAGLVPTLMLDCRQCHKRVPFGYCPSCSTFNPVNFLQMVKFWAQARAAGVAVTNVFHEHPDKDNEQLFFGGRLDDVCLDIPSMAIGSKKLYLLKQFRHHLDALFDEIVALSPNIIVTLGNTATWAILGQTGIKKIRGTVQDTRFGIKVLSTYHPAALRDWSLRPTIVSDLKKATQESHSSTITRPRTWIHTHPTLEEIESWFGVPAKRYSCDIESGTVLFSKAELGRIKKHIPRSYHILTSLISMVGFARSEDQGLVIPFMSRREEDGILDNYWPDQWSECRAWDWVQYGLSSGAELVTQNGMYDYNRLLCSGIHPRNMKHDDMLLSHALFPEMPKSLGYLDSIYRNDSPWKTMYGSENLKRDE